MALCYGEVVKMHKLIQFVCTHACMESVNYSIFITQCMNELIIKNDCNNKKINFCPLYM